MTLNTDTAVPARERILEAANRLLYSEGLRVTGVDRMLAEPDVAEMSFRRCPPAGRYLVTAFFEHRRNECIGWFRSEVEGRIAEKGASLGAIADALETWFAHAESRGWTFINTVAERVHGEERITRVAVDRKADLASYVEELATRSGLAAPARVAEAVVAVIEGWVLRAQLSGCGGYSCTGRMLLRGVCRDYAMGKTKPH